MSISTTQQILSRTFFPFLLACFYSGCDFFRAIIRARQSASAVHVNPGCSAPRPSLASSLIGATPCRVWSDCLLKGAYLLLVAVFGPYAAHQPLLAARLKRLVGVGHVQPFQFHQVQQRLHVLPETTSNILFKPFMHPLASGLCIYSLRQQPVLNFHPKK